MDDPVVVRDGERRADLDHDLDRLLRRQATLLVEAVLQRAARQVLHHDVDEPVRLLPEVEDARDVRVVEARGAERLGIEPPTEVDVALEGLVEHLHGDRHHQLAVTGLVDGADAASTDDLLDQELPSGEGATDLRVVAVFDGERADVRKVLRVTFAQVHVRLRPAAAHDLLFLGDRHDPLMDLLDDRRAQRDPQLAQGLRIGHLGRADPRELAVHQVRAHLALERRVAPVSHVLQDEQANHDIDRRAAPSARAAMRPSARQRLVGGIE